MLCSKIWIIIKIGHEIQDRLKAFFGKNGGGTWSTTCKKRENSNSIRIGIHIAFSSILIMQSVKLHFFYQALAALLGFAKVE